jgi:hypothetical protein
MTEYTEKYVPIIGACCGTCKYWDAPVTIRAPYTYSCSLAERILMGKVPYTLSAETTFYYGGCGCPTYAQIASRLNRFVCGRVGQTELPCTGA